MLSFFLGIEKTNSVKLFYKREKKVVLKKREGERKPKKQKFKRKQKIKKKKGEEEKEKEKKGE